MARRLLFLWIAVVLALSLVGPLPALAQDGFSTGATPNYGSVNLGPGFTPDPHTVSLASGGSVSADYLGCPGFATSQPDFNLYWDGGSQLKIYVESGGDTVLIINDPQSNWVCDDDSHGNTNPEITFSSAAGGLYNIWVASFGQDTYHDATLFITEMVSGGPTTDGLGPMFIDPGLQQPYLAQLTLDPGTIQRAFELAYQPSGFDNCIASSDDSTQLNPQARYVLTGAGDAPSGDMQAIVNSGKLAGTDLGFQPQLGNGRVAIIIVDDFTNAPDDSRPGVSHGYLVANLLYRWRDTFHFSDPEQIQIDGVDVKDALSGQLSQTLYNVLDLKRQAGYQRFILNLSFSIQPCEGGDLSQQDIDQDPLWNTIRDMVYQGVVVVGAAGNFGYNEPGYPARWPEIVSVSGQVINEPNRWQFSNSGEVMVTAGWYEFDLGGQYTFQIGTSFAAPYVALRIALDLTWTDMPCYMSSARRMAHLAAGNFPNMPYEQWARCD